MNLILCCGNAALLKRWVSSLQEGFATYQATTLQDLRILVGQQIIFDILLVHASHVDRDIVVYIRERKPGCKLFILADRPDEEEGIRYLRLGVVGYANSYMGAERLQEAVRAIVLHSHGRRHQVSASIGIALFPLHGEQPQQVLANADLAMYQAKAKGRGVWHLFSGNEQAREQVDSRVLWKQKIADALAENRFELHGQPILHIPTQRVTRMEVLLRMRETDGTLVYPDRFIPIAEHTGQIRAIDHWVLARAIALMHEQPELCLSVNLSAGALEDPSLLPDIEAQLRDQNIVAARVTFEITETVAINNLQDAIRLMHSIRQLGCRFALDDFGSGFASYAYLRQLPIDDVKIDGTFIRELAANREDQIFVKSITDIAHGMGKRVVAEFVENEEILRILGEIGVDYAQGYHIGRPAPLPAA